jgi:hypothetical protein
MSANFFGSQFVITFTVTPDLAKWAGVMTMNTLFNMSISRYIFAFMNKVAFLALVLVGLLRGFTGVVASEGQMRIPSDVNINEDAGSGSHVFVMIRLEDGEELPFLLDTGSPVTLFDRSLKVKLGKRLDRVTLWVWGNKQNSEVFAAPKIYLGDTPLVTDTTVTTFDFRDLSSFAGRPIKGILGMDCLQHYCIQLDFPARKMRFLQPAQMNARLSGKPYALEFSGVGQDRTNFFRPYIHKGSVVGEKGTSLLVDTGLNIDGAMDPQLLRKQRSGLAAPAVEKVDRFSWNFRESVWDGESFTNIVVREAAGNVAGKGANVMGLRFLARHLVTFDFPNHTMYLLQQSIGPLPDESVRLIRALEASKNELPADIDARLNAIMAHQRPPFLFRWFGGTLTMQNQDKSAFYHFTVSRKFGHSQWKLKKAWQADRQDRTVQEYSIP